MKERPILFSAPMVRAILDSSKTQTRRVVKPAPEMVADKRIEPWSGNPADLLNLLLASKRGCPYGKPGDRLWVKETWKPKISHSCGTDGCDCETVYVDYPAGGDGRYFNGEIPAAWCMPQAAVRGNSVPSIHMPRWASRILLEVVSVRVERLHELNEQDAIAEGIEQIPCEVPNTKLWRNYRPENGWTPRVCIPQNSFRSLWESINGVESWLANPWVWVVEFMRVPP